MLSRPPALTATPAHRYLNDFDRRSLIVICADGVTAAHVLSEVLWGARAAICLAAPHTHSCLTPTCADNDRCPCDGHAVKFGGHGVTECVKRGLLLADLHLHDQFVVDW